MSFIETPRFPDDIAHGVIESVEFNTDVIIRHSGHENRFPNWEAERMTFDASYGAKTIDQARNLLKFFRIARGRAYGFRVRDWMDYEVAQSDGSVEIDTTVQARNKLLLHKSYTSSPNTYRRRIPKPLDNGTFDLWVNMVLQTVGGGATGYTIDYTQGVVTKYTTTQLGLDMSNGVSGTTTQLTFTAAHGFTAGDTVSIAFAPFTHPAWYEVISVTNANTIVIDFDSTGFAGPWDGVNKVYANYRQSDVIQWKGEYDVPARFDSDKLSVEVNDGHADVSQVNVRELRHYEL